MHWVIFSLNDSQLKKTIIQNEMSKCFCTMQIILGNHGNDKEVPWRQMIIRSTKDYWLCTKLNSQSYYYALSMIFILKLV